MPFQVHGRRRRPSQMWHGVVHSSTAPIPVACSRSILKGDGLSPAYPTSCPCHYSLHQHQHHHEGGGLSPETDKMSANSSVARDLLP